MKNEIEQPPLIKAERREIKKRPRMKMSGSSLRVPSRHAGMKLAVAAKKKKR